MTHDLDARVPVAPVTPVTPVAFHILLALATGERHGYAIMDATTLRHDCLDTCLQWSVRRFRGGAGRSRRPSTRADGLIGVLGGRVSSHRP